MRFFKKKKYFVWSIAIVFLLSQILVTPVFAQATASVTKAVTSSVPTVSDTVKDRIAGADRYTTAAAVSRQGWKTADYAVLARGDNFADALCAGPLAQKYGGPILLTPSDQLNAAALTELKRLGVKHLFIVGGLGAVSSNVEDALKAAEIATIERIAGNDRYETSVKIAQKIGNTGKAVLATGDDFPDALSISGIAGKLGMPILLSAKDTLPASVSSYFQGNTVTNTYVVGGAGVIRDAVMSDVPAPTRLAGTDRYTTNAAILQNFAGELNYDTLYVAVGNNFADALTGAVLAGKSGSPLVLTEKTLPAATTNYLQTKLNLSSRVIGLGGNSVAPSAVLTDIVIAKEQIPVAEKFSTAGTYGPDTGSKTIQGSVIISARDVTLKNTVIEGDLLLGGSIGDGNVTLKDVTVKGKTIINGGGPHSIIMYNFSGQDVVVNVPDGGNVRLVAQGSTSIAGITMESDGTLEESDQTGSGFVNVEITEGVQVTFIGVFGEVNIDGDGANITLPSGSSIATLNVNEHSDITGQGQIGAANVNSGGVTIEQTPTTTTTVASGLTAMVGGVLVTGTSNLSSGGGGGGGRGGADTRTITGYYTNNNGTDTALVTTATVPFGTAEADAKAGLSTAGYAKLSDNSYVAITIAWAFDAAYSGTTTGAKAVTGTVSGTFVGGQTPVNRTGTVTVSADTRTITGYYTNNDGTDTALVTTATVPYGTAEADAKAGLSTAGYAKLSDNSYVAITIAWAFDAAYSGTTTGAKAVTGTVSGTFVGGQTPVNRTGTVTVSADTRTITGYYTNNDGTDTALVTTATVPYGTAEADAKAGLSTTGYAKLSDNSYVAITIAWAFDAAYSGTTTGAKAVTGTVSGTFAGGQTPVNRTGTVTVSADTRTITGYYTNNNGTDTALVTTATVPYGTAEETAKAGLSTTGYAKLSDNSYVAITIAWAFDAAYSGTTVGAKTVTGTVSGTFAGGQTPVNRTGTVTVSADTRTITGYYTNNDGTDTALVTTATVPYGTAEAAAKAGLSTTGYAKLSDNSYVAITIAWAFDAAYSGTTTGAKAVTGTVSGTFAGGQTPVNQTGTVTVSADTRTIKGYYANNDGTDTALVTTATVPFGTAEAAAKAGLSTAGYAKLSDGSYVAITIAWAFDAAYSGTTVGAKAVTGTVSGTFAGGQTPVNRTGTVTVSADTRTITGYYTNNNGTDTALVTTATVPFGTAEAAAKAGLSTTGYAKLSDNSYVAITIAWAFDGAYSGTTTGAKAVTGTVSGTFAGGQTPVNRTGTVTVVDTRTITGYYTNNDGTDTALVTTATVPWGTAEETAKAGLSTSGYAKLSDGSYVAITIAWTFDTAYGFGTTVGAKTVTGTVSGTFAGGQTPVNRTGTVTVVDTRTITGYYTNNDGTDTALVTTATVPWGTAEETAKAGLSTSGYAKLSDGSYVAITIAWTFDTAYGFGTTVGAKTVTGTVSGTFAGGQTPVNQTGTVTVVDTRTITGYYSWVDDSPLVTTATVPFGTAEAAAKAGLSTSGYAKFSDGSYEVITIAWTFDTAYSGTTAGTKTVTGTVSGTFAGGQTPVNQTGTVTVSADTRTIKGYYTNNDGTDTALVTTATVPFGTAEAAAKAGLSTTGYAKLSDNSYVAITIAWAFNAAYSGTTTGAKAVTGTVSGTFVGGQTPVNRTGTVTVSALTQVTSPEFTVNDGDNVLTITLTGGTFKAAPITANNFTFSGADAWAFQNASTFTRTSDNVVTITGIDAGYYCYGSNNTVTVKTAALATAATAVTAVSSSAITDVTSAAFPVNASYNTVTIELISGTFKAGTIAASDFTFTGTNAVRFAAGTFTRNSDTLVTITGISPSNGADDKVTVKAATLTTSETIGVNVVASLDYFCYSGDTITYYDTNSVETRIVIPSSLGETTITQIGDYAFWNRHLSELTIPEGITSIGESAFGVNNFTSITIPSSVTTIGNQAFFNCNQLTTITIANGSITIPDYFLSMDNKFRDEYDSIRDSFGSGAGKYQKQPDGTWVWSEL